MKRATLLSTVAATLLLTAGAVSAQQPKQDEAPAKAPVAQQNAPAEKVAPAMKPGEHKAGAEQKAPAATTGQAPKASDADKTRATAPAMNKSDNDAAKAAPDAKGNADVKGKADGKAEADVKSKSSASEAKPADKPADKAAQGAPATDTKASTTGQGAAGSAKLSTEQRTKITTIVRQQKVERVEPSKLNISISVGTRIPERGVRFHPLPREVFVIYPEWRGYDYILVGDQIIVVDPRSHEIVAILDA